MAEQPQSSKIDLSEFHPKIQKLFFGKEYKLRMIDEWVLGETLGMGGYSKVKLGLHKKTGKKVALKIMFADQTGQISASKTRQLIRELTVMSKVKHPNVIELISYNDKAKYPEANGKYTHCICTALEFAAGGELFDYLMYTGRFDDKATRSYFQQLIAGLEALHKAGIAHRDLKPENLLLDSTFTLKIADFGFATEFVDENGKKHKMNTPCGTKNYLAPEFWRGQQYSHKCDIFAAGIILFTTYAGFPPFMEAQPKDWWWDKYSYAVKYEEKAKICDDQKQAENLKADAKKRMALFWKAHSKKMQFNDEDFKELALNLIHPNPDKRMDINLIKEHKWYKGPIYNSMELKTYLQQRVRIVLQNRAKKIRKMMIEQKRKQITYNTRPVIPTEMTDMQKRAKQIDPKDLFVDNMHHVKDDLFINTLYQFFTYVPPAEMAARIERAAIAQNCNIDISPRENLITIECGLNFRQKNKKIETEQKSENVMFSVKQFLIDDAFHTNPNLEKIKANEDDNESLPPAFKRTLSTSYVQRYIVSFKRLKGKYEIYREVADKFFLHPDVAVAMTFDEFDLDKE